ncbi:hypothetical protein [Leptolyngbya sp. 7M]|uniref:hypothetical protein n=1 Tax=Leptolyngbya sp. 7M TaxID=2812896 RepID=UPI001B8B2FA6|nr:hypothetical protein [Leptolyngbya sp. 7M]QYO64154.1 hypothetical protein JVX88_31100 [Leptolyngbya sp. 7M]
MMSDVNTTGDVTTANYDAQQLVEEIKEGEEQAPNVDVSADYERSKQFDVAEVDRTEAGSQAAAEVSSESSTSAGDPNAFREMAKEVNKPDEE